MGVDKPTPRPASAIVNFWADEIQYPPSPKNLFNRIVEKVIPNHTSRVDFLNLIK